MSLVRESGGGRGGGLCLLFSPPVKHSLSCFQLWSSYVNTKQDRTHM